jgi:predicted DsbA family dithiol-disulfide isomerase
MRIEIYSDIACPWCFIGHCRLERALADFPHGDRVDVRYRPFQLDPAAPRAAIPLPVRLEERFGAAAAAKMREVAEVAEGDGITMNWDEALAVNTRDAHRLAHLAEAEVGPAGQRSLMLALFAAHFTHGMDVGDPDRLAGLAAEVGMDGDRVRAYLASDEGEAAVAEGIEDARRLGIQGVPTFVFDGQYGLSGAHPPESLRQVMDQLWAGGDGD